MWIKYMFAIKRTRIHRHSSLLYYVFGPECARAERGWLNWIICAGERDAGEEYENEKDSQQVRVYVYAWHIGNQRNQCASTSHPNDEGTKTKRKRDRGTDRRRNEMKQVYLPLFVAEIQTNRHLKKKKHRMTCCSFGARNLFASVDFCPICFSELFVCVLKMDYMCALRWYIELYMFVFRWTQNCKIQKLTRKFTNKLCARRTFLIFVSKINIQFEERRSCLAVADSFEIEANADTFLLFFV